MCLRRRSWLPPKYRQCRRRARCRRSKNGSPDAEEALLLAYPIAAETADVPLNDMAGQHVTTSDALVALDSAKPGPVAEGNVGGGTGMVCNGFKGGTGTASRKLPAEAGGYTVGVLVQCNYGAARQLRVAGIPVAREMTLQPRCVSRLTSPPATNKRSGRNAVRSEAGGYR